MTLEEFGGELCAQTVEDVEVLGTSGLIFTVIIGPGGPERRRYRLYYSDAEQGFAVEELHA